MRSKWIPVCSLVMGGMLMVACGKEIPEDIIQPDAMENLLYDYHMASTMVNSLPYNEGYKKEAYYEYVFQKHQVTQAEFDSSMVWYTRHNKMLADIYSRLGERYRKAEERLKFLAEKRDGKRLNVFLSGDSVDVWQDRSLYWLTTADLTNKVVFEMKTDTTFKPKDRLEMVADFTWVPAGADSLREAVMALSVEFENDSLCSKTYRIHTSGTHRLELIPDSAYAYKRVSGFIYYAGRPEDKTSLLVNHISLKRYRHIENSSSAIPSSATVKKED